MNTYTVFTWFKSLNGIDFGTPYSTQLYATNVELPCVANRKVWVRYYTGVLKHLQLNILWIIIYYN